MLSKYYDLDVMDRSDRQGKGALEPFVEALMDRLRAQYSHVELAATSPGGTLGIFFDLWLNGKRQFVKTHRPGRQYQENIQKEADVLAALYGEELAIDCETIRICDQEQTFLRMDYLQYPRQRLAPTVIWNCIMDYQRRMSGQEYPVRYCFAEVVRAGQKSRNLLYEKGLISETLYERLENSISRLEERVSLLPKVICHGDLSDVNIMCREDDGKIFVIDWEDSLVAFPDYDFLYWLTFISHRPLYQKGFLEQYGINSLFGTDIMALIVLVKCGLSYRNGSYIHDRISFNDRLSELYKALI